PEGFGRLAAALASSADTGSRLEALLTRLTISSRALTVVFGVLFGLVHGPRGTAFAVASLVLLAYTAFAPWYQLRTGSLERVRVLALAELVLTVGAIMATGGLTSPFILTPFTGLLLVGYVWGRRATFTVLAGAIAAAAAAVVVIRSADAADQRAAAQL